MLYRWAPGYYVVVNGVRTYPPVRRYEAYSLARAYGHKGPMTVIMSKHLPEVLDNALNLPLDFDSPHTIRDYLRTLLLTLWREKEGFSGKRPFGDSGWEREIYAPLIRHKVIDGRLDENGYVDYINETEADEFVWQLIEHIFDSVVLPNVEVVAARVHEAWMLQKRETGITSRLSESGEEQMVPYEQLSDPIKELDRTTVRAVYSAIRGSR